MENYDQSEIINIGLGKDISIKELTQKKQDIVGYKGEVEWDTGKPDGTQHKLLNFSRLHDIGWEYTTELDYGIKKTYELYKSRL